MRVSLSLLSLCLLAITAVAGAQACPGRYCVYVPFTARDEATVPAPSSIPSPIGTPLASVHPSASAEPSASTVPAPITGWISGAPSPIVRAEAEGVAVDGKLYLFGGYSYPLNGFTPYSRVDVYDLTTDTWIRLRDLPRAVNHAGVATDGLYVYFAGGYVANDAGDGSVYGSRDVIRYDIVADTYAPLPPLPLERAAGALVLVDRTLHFFGGTNIERTVDTGEHWALDLDALASSWLERASLPNPRHHLGAVTLNGQIYAIGGQHDHDAALVTQRDVHRYDAATDAWTAIAPLPAIEVGGATYGRSHIGAATFVRDGLIVVAGGEYAHMEPLRDVVAYDPATDRWQDLGALPERRSSGVARQLGATVVYATGATDGGELTNTTLTAVP